MKHAGRLAIAFLLAVCATAALASIAQTQINLSALTALGVSVPLGLRALTTLQDVVFFGPVMAAIATAGFLPAFLLAGLAARLFPAGRFAIHALAGGVALWTAFQLMGFVTPMPTLVAAARTQAGLLALSATGLVGGGLFAYATRRVFGQRLVVARTVS